MHKTVSVCFSVCVYVHLRRSFSHICIPGWSGEFSGKLWGITRTLTDKGSPSLSVVSGGSVCGFMSCMLKMQGGVEGFSYSWVCGLEYKQSSPGKDDEYLVLVLTRNDLIYKVKWFTLCSNENDWVSWVVWLSSSYQVAVYIHVCPNTYDTWSELPHRAMAIQTKMTWSPISAKPMWWTTILYI